MQNELFYLNRRRDQKYLVAPHLNTVYEIDRAQQINFFLSGRKMKPFMHFDRPL